MRALLLCALALAPLTGWAANLKVLALLSDDSAPYQSFANTLKKDMPDGIQVTVLEHPDQLPHDILQIDLIVSVGLNAAKSAIAQSETPVLAAMVSRADYEALLKQTLPTTTTVSISALYLDQPWARQIAFLRAALPERRRIGLLHSLDTQIDFEQLRQVVAAQGGALVNQPIQGADDLYPVLESVLTKSDVLLSIADSRIYNNGSIRNILLTSYRLGVPLIGLSQAYVNAGALCAIFSTPEQLAAQTRALVTAYAHNQELPKPQYSTDFTISVNQPVAQSLKIELSSPEAIRNRMSKKKGRAY